MIDSAQFELIVQSTEYILADHLGSASITTNADGDKTSEVHYTPWGRSHFFVERKRIPTDGVHLHGADELHG
jgi:hypothetical protein